MFYALGVITRIVVWILLAIFAVVAIAGLIFLLLNFATNVVTAITSRPPAPPPTAAPAGPVATYTSLKYDETGGTTLIAGQSKLIALYIREAMAANGSQQAMEIAIGKIQTEAQNARATVKEDTSLTLPRDSAWLVWCSNSTNIKAPTDVSDVMGALRTGPGKIWIVVPFAAGVPWPSQNTFSGCSSKFWSVAVH